MRIPKGQKSVKWPVLLQRRPLLSYGSVLRDMSPSQLFLGRQLRTRLDLLRPDPERRVSERQANQKKYHDSKARSREFQIGVRVMARDWRSHSQVPWKPEELLLVA